MRVGGVMLRLLRPSAPEELIDEHLFEEDEFLPYWAELWPAATALASALPERLDGVRVVELGCGLGLPSLVAAARGGEVTALDWAAEAIDLLRRNAERNRIDLEAAVHDWREQQYQFEVMNPSRTNGLVSLPLQVRFGHEQMEPHSEAR